MDVAAPLVLPAEDVAFLTAQELTQAYRRGELSPREVASALLDRIQASNPLVNAFVFTDRDTTLAMAADSERRWRAGEPLGDLDGVPVTIKDLIAVRGWPLTRGSPALKEDPPPSDDAPSVARLREAGAVFLGKTATPDAGSKIVTRSQVHGVTANPYDLSRTPGGSSGGASAALALGIGPIALGTDGAGSVRIPAAWTGVYGIKPSFGRVPAYPPSMFMPHAVIGPMSRCVDDAIAAMGVIALPDQRDPYALSESFDARRARLASVAGLRIGITRDFGTKSPPIDDDILHAVEFSADALRSAGAHVEEIDPVWPCDPYDTFMVFWEATYAGFLATAYSTEKSARMDTDLVAIAKRGSRISIEGYHRALGQRVALASASKAIFNRYDLLLGPVMPCQPPSIEADAPVGFEPGDWRWCPFTYLWNMTGQPAASAPWGVDRNGMPLGVQLVGWVGSEAEVFCASTAIEKAADVMPRPALAAGGRLQKRSNLK